MIKRLFIATGIFSPDIGGPASYANSLGRRLSGLGIRVSVLTYSSVFRHAPDADIPFRVHRIWTKIPWGFRHALFLFRALWLMLRADGVLLLNATTAGLPTMAAALLMARPIIVRVVGDYAWETAVQTRATFLLVDDFQASVKSGRVKRLDFIQKWVCRRATAVVVPSQYLANLVAGWGIDTKKIHVIYNGAELSRIDLTREEARRKIGIAGSIIISCGRLVPWKGFRMLIKIMPQLLRTNQFFRLVIVGDGPDCAALVAMIRTLGLDRKVFLVGRKDRRELALYLAAADVFVLNTGYEGFSHQILEAMTAGVPVITTSVGGNREIVSQGENGLLVRYNDEFNLVEAIKIVTSDNDLRERLIANARRTKAKFSVERMCEQTTALLNATFGMKHANPL